MRDFLPVAAMAAETGGAAPAAQPVPPVAEPAAPPVPAASPSSLLDGTPAATPPAPGTQPAAPAAPAAPPAPGKGGWLDKLSAEDKAWAEAKGYNAETDPAAVAASYRQLEKLFGADRAGNTVTIPKDPSDKAAWDALYDKLGRPTSPDKYDIAVPPGADDKLATATKGWFHRAGLTVEQAKAVTESYNAAFLEQEQARDTALAQEIETMKTNLGLDKLNNMVETGKAALRAAKVSENEQRFLERALGPARFWEVFAFMGQNYVESGPLAEGRKAPGFGHLSPAAAEARVAELRKHPDFLSKDTDARMRVANQINELSEIAARARIG